MILAFANFPLGKFYLKKIFNPKKKTKKNLKKKLEKKNLIVKFHFQFGELLTSNMLLAKRATMIMKLGKREMKGTKIRLALSQWRKPKKPSKPSNVVDQ